MRKNREIVFKHLIGSEGGYSNRSLAEDPGGPTKYGVTLADLRIWRGNPDLQAVDVKNLTLSEAKEIFFHRYWDVVKGDELPSGLDYAVSDFGYHSGPGCAIEYLQRQMGVKVDRVMGMKTLAAVNKIDDTSAFINAYQDNRLAYCKRLKNWRANKNGWTTRIDDEVRANSVALVNDATPAAAPAKTESADGAPAYRSPVKTAQQGTMLSALGTGATDYAQQLAPHIDTFALLKYAFVGLTLTGIAVSLYMMTRQGKEA